MSVSAEGSRVTTRLIAAIIISPSVPITALSLAYWQGTASSSWFAIFFVFGYLFFLILGLPIVAILLKKRRLWSCILAGSVVTIAPLLLLRAMSLSFSLQGITVETLVNHLFLAVAGGLGGALFWWIAFAKIRKV